MVITQSVNLTYGGVNYTQFTRPVQQITLLDSTNIQFLRQVMLSNDGVKLIKGSYVIQFPMEQLFAVAAQAFPSMSWAPIITPQPTSSVVFPNTISLATASLNIGATDEFNTVAYQWYVSSSESGPGFVPPVATTHWHFQNTSSATMTASFNSTGGFAENTASFFCVASNASGQTSSSIGYVYVSTL